MAPKKKTINQDAAFRIYCEMPASERKWSEIARALEALGYKTSKSTPATLSRWAKTLDWEKQAYEMAMNVEGQTPEHKRRIFELKALPKLSELVTENAIIGAQATLLEHITSSIPNVKITTTDELEKAFQILKETQVIVQDVRGTNISKEPPFVDDRSEERDDDEMGSVIINFSDKPA